MWLIMNNPGLLNSILFWSFSESAILSNGFSFIFLFKLSFEIPNFETFVKRDTKQI